eukprot:COSAG05_NODE_317_length_11545_cov_73.981391_13_plen_60_part_00
MVFLGLGSRAFRRCMRRLGLGHPLLLRRLFSIFDQRDMQFLTEDEFLEGMRMLCEADAG